MHDTPVDALYVWLGVAAAGLAAFGVVLAFPTTTPPDPDAAAATIDEVAAAPPGSVAEHRLDAERLRFDGRTVGLENEGGRAHATVTADSVVPATATPSLRRVRDGEDPRRVFSSSDAFGRAVREACEGPAEWQTAPERLVVRHVRWEGVDVALVG